MIMFRVTLVALFTLFCSTTFAQKGFEDVVYLKNGSVIRGMVVEQVPGVSLKIETADRSVFVYKMDEVERITKEKTVKAGVENVGVGKGYEGLVQGGYSIGVGQYGIDRAKFSFVNGYRFSPRIYCGVGLGIRAYTGSEDGQLLVPAFLNIRYTAMDKRVSPYVGLSTGLSFNANKDFNTESFMVEPEVGVSLRLGQRTALLIGLAFDLQMLNFYDIQPFGYRTVIVERVEKSTAVGVNVGLAF